jgi:hypothetical protein
MGDDYRRIKSELQAKMRGISVILEESTPGRWAVVTESDKVSLLAFFAFVPGERPISEFLAFHPMRCLAPYALPRSRVASPRPPSATIVER